MATREITITQRSGGFLYSFDNQSSFLVKFALTDGPRPTLDVEQGVVPAKSNADVTRPKNTYALWCALDHPDQMTDVIEGQVEAAGKVKIGTDWVLVYETMTGGNTAFFYDV